MLGYNKLKIEKCNHFEMIIFIFIVLERLNSIYCFKQWNKLSLLISMLELILCTALLVRFFKLNKIPQKSLIILIFITGLLIICFFKNKTKMPLLALLIYLNGRTENFDNLSKVIRNAYGGLFMLSLFLYFLGISDSGISRGYDLSRSAVALGFTHPNAAAETIVFFVIAWSCSKIKSEKAFYIISIWGFLIVLFILKSRTASILLAIVIIFCNLKKRKKKWVSVPIIASFSPFILAFFSYKMQFIAKMPIFQTLNVLFAKRLYLLELQLSTYKLSLFGQQHLIFDLGLDNSYVSYGLQYGLILMLIYIFANCATVFKAWKNRKIEICIFSIIMSLYAFMENGFFNVFVNFILLYLLVENKKMVAMKMKNNEVVK